MKYWRKMLLALFAVCLFAGMGFSADLSAQSICDPDCKDGMLFIGDMYYDGSYPYQGWECEHLNWPLDGAIWGCETGFLNSGYCDVSALQWDLKGLIPHKVEWSESTKTLFVSYIQPWEGEGSPIISVLNLEEGYQHELQPYDWDDISQKNLDVGAMGLDDARHILYVSNLDKDDSTIKVLNVEDPFNPVELLCDAEFDLCACCDCGDWNAMNMDMVFYKDKLYVSYWSYRDGSKYGDPTIAVFNANPDDVHFGEVEDCVRVVCPCDCIDENDSYFLASNLAVSEVDGEVIVFSTYHPEMSMFGAWHFGFYLDEEWEDYVNRPLGVIAATNMSTTESICVDMNSASMRQKLVKAGVDLCDESKLELRALDINPCGCGDCEDLVIYVTAMQYRRGMDWSFKTDWLPCWPACWDDVEVNIDKAICPEQGHVLALTYNVDDCNDGEGIDIKSVKNLPTKTMKVCGYMVDFPWQPGDIVATSWVKENNVVVEAPVSADGTVTITTKYLNVDDATNDLTFDFMWDPAVLQFTSHKITKEGTAEEFDTMPTSNTPGAFSWDDILAEFQDGLGNLETLTLEMTFTPIAATDATVVFAGGEGIYGYECFETTGNGGGDECPDFAYDPCDGVTLTEITSSATDPVLGAFTLEASDTECCEEGELCIYVNTEYEGTPVLWQFDGDETWTSVSTDVTEGATFEGCSFDYQLCVTIDPDTVASVDEWAVVEAGYGDPGDGDDTDDETIVDDDDNGTGAGGESDDDDSSSGCNVGFSAAALLFAVPLVSIFRKR